jgi:hypothetical protein
MSQDQEVRFSKGQRVFRHYREGSHGTTFARKRVEKIDEEGVWLEGGEGPYDPRTGRETKAYPGSILYIQEWVDSIAKPEEGTRAASAKEKERPKNLDISTLMKQSVRPSDIELKDKEIRNLKRDIRRAAKEAGDLREQLEFLEKIGEPVIEDIPFLGSPDEAKTTQASALLIASDWHVEEIVDPKTVTGLNKYSPEIAKQRAERFFQVGQRLTDIISRDLKLDHIVLGLLGDFITGDLHEDSAENAAMPKTEAAMYAQELIASGIIYLLEHSPKRHIIVKCHSGNHGRTTKRIHWAKEKGHSLEWMMYVNLAKYFESEDRVKFDIADGYHSWLDVHGVEIRWHHGHAMDYRGGVGGLTIPVLRAIKEWDMGRQADLDIFGHFHTHFDGTKFLSNGSLIGYSPYSIRIKAPYDVPKQWFTVIDAKRGRTYAAPLYVEE